MIRGGQGRSARDIRDAANGLVFFILLSLAGLCALVVFS